MLIEIYTLPAYSRMFVIIWIHSNMLVGSSGVPVFEHVPRNIYIGHIIAWLSSLTLVVTSLILCIY